MTIQGIRRQREAELRRMQQEQGGGGPHAAPQAGGGSHPASSGQASQQQPSHHPHHPPSSSLEVLCPKGRSAVNLIATWSIATNEGNGRWAGHSTYVAMVGGGRYVGSHAGLPVGLLVHLFVLWVWVWVYVCIQAAWSVSGGASIRCWASW